jgi:two-component system chemotaxis response regulator CheV
MAGVMDSVNQRTQLVGQNRLELLLFRLDGSSSTASTCSRCGKCCNAPLTLMPKSSPVRGGEYPGATIPILDLAMATGSGALKDKNSVRDQRSTTPRPRVSWCARWSASST